MYSLVYCEDVSEYYIFKSRNVIQDEDDTCVVAFKANVVLNHDSKTELQDIRNNLLEHPLRSHGGDFMKQTLENEEQVETVLNADQHSTKNCMEVSDCHKSTKKYCYFCRKMYRKLIYHLTKAHRRIKEVRKLNALSKESPKRRKIIYRILKKSKEKEIESQIYWQSQNCSKFRRREISKIICHDELIMQFGCGEYSNGKCNVKRQRDLRVLGHILLEMKKHDSTITDLSSVFTPQVIHILNKIKNRMLSSFGTRLLYQCGHFILNQRVCKKDLIKKKNVEEFLRLIVKMRKTKRAKHKKIVASGTQSSNRKAHAPIITIKKEERKNELTKPSENDVEVSDLMLQPSTDVENDQILPNDNRGEEGNNLEPPHRTDVGDNEDMKNHYLLRERNCDQNYISEMQDEIYDTILNESDKKECVKHKSKGNKKKPFYYCCYCKKRFSRYLTLHLLRKHKTEEDVLTLSSLPKGSLERKRMIDSIIKKCTSKLNNDTNIQNKKIISQNENLSDVNPSEITRDIKEEINDDYRKENELEHSNARDSESFVENYELITSSLEFKDNPLEEDDTNKSSLWYMLEDHVNCNPDVKM